ncbi:hypothetical protein [Bacillus infantis]|uniref:Uncharacterized protein n=1 Tax=Bacillus infantis TaxID=324767 RepID=A0A5D4RFN5_9BACI|nr:hypothetical protein [Bacillus infantis]TYS50107.1 hypothetical protein FZD51_06020 [Bacillus infantis]
MADLDGMQIKFTVVKNDDIEKYLSKNEQEKLIDCVGQIEMSRAIEGLGNAKYLVINTDEPYADEVIEIMKCHGHWGNGNRVKVIKDIKFEGESFSKGQEFDVKTIPSRLPASIGVFVSGKWFCDVGSPIFEEYFKLLD